MDITKPANRNRKLYLILSVIIVVTLIMVATKYGGRALNPTYLRAVVANLGTWGPLLYGLGYILLSLVGFSTSVMSLFAIEFLVA